VEHTIERLLPFRERPAWLRYGAAGMIVGAFALLRAGLNSHLHDYSFFLFSPALFLSSLLFGRGPGWAATILGTVLAVGPFSYPPSRITVAEDDIIPLTLFILTCLGTSEISGALRRALTRAREAERRYVLLLRETEHRTKNNFQIIRSVLSAQARNQSDPVVRQVLEAATARIDVIAKAQDRLRFEDGDGRIRLDEYLTDLCDGLREVLREVRPIDLSSTAERIEVPTTTAVPIGLIVNELVTNSFKYAFPDGRPGRISVSIVRTDDEHAELVVADDGIGLTQDGSPQGLGTRLTNLLCQQLDGEIRREAGNPGCRVVAKVRLESA
jgi:two-component sensor histidine kinase